MMSGRSVPVSVSGVGFSRPALVHGSAGRHCFLSLPQSWLGLPIPSSSLPVFVMEVSCGKSLVLSWAGDTHGSGPGSLNQDEEVVLVAQELLQSNGISNGEAVVVTQVSVPPSCETISVGVNSLEDWQDLALNIDSAQSEFLNQVRVVSVGEIIPLWLAGGVCVRLNVLRISPPLNIARLDPMSQVEILPPSQSQDFKDSDPIGFNPSFNPSSLTENGSIQNISEVKFGNENKNNCHESDSDEGNKHAPINTDKLLLKMIFNFIKENNTKRYLKNSLFTRKELVCSFRVLPMPFTHSSELSNILNCHPSLIVISKSSVKHSHYKDSIRLFGDMKLIELANDVQNNSKIKKEDQFDGERVNISSNKDNRLESSDKVVALVWENFLENKNFEGEFVNEMNKLVIGHNCVVSNGLRRMRKLEATKIVELKTCTEADLKTVPVSVDVTPIISLEKEQKKKVSDIVKKTIFDVLSVCDIIINSESLLEIKMDSLNIDILMSTRDKLPLHLSLESAAILDISLESLKPESLPSITKSSKDLDNFFMAHFAYLGDKEMLNSLYKYIMNGLDVSNEHIKTVSQFIIVQGSKGSGKSSLVETTAQYLSHSPYFIYCDMLQFKHLHGKKVETIEKKLQNVLKEAIRRRPSLIILEDLDQIVGAPGPTDQEAGPVYEQTMQMVSAFKKLLGQLITFNQDSFSYFQSENPQMGQVMVVATCADRTQVHPLLTTPQGCHYFPITISLPVITADDRYNALCHLLSGFVKSSNEVGHLKDFICNETEKKSLVVSKTNEYLHGINLDEKTVRHDTEGFILPDLSHLAVRVFLEAKKRLKSKEKDNLKENTTRNLKKVSENKTTLPKLSICNEDLKAALQGYTPLTLRGMPSETNADKPSIRVGGLSEAQHTLEEVLTWPSQFPSLFAQVSLRLRSGVLLYGPPGCGKTLLANSVARSCNLRAITVKGPELLSKYIGASEQAVRESFERAQSAAPCILFFDEFESLAPRRGHDSTGVTDRVVNQLLTQMDGVEGLSGVYILAATSRPDLIDPALLRPGRLDKCVFCPMPSKEDRSEILHVLSESMNLGEVIDWESVVDATEKFSGADLQSLLSTAQIIVAQEAIGEELYGGIIDTLDSKVNVLAKNPIAQEAIGEELCGGIEDKDFISDDAKNIIKEGFQGEILSSVVKDEKNTINIIDNQLSSEITENFNSNGGNASYELEKPTGAIKKQKQIYIERERELVYFDNTYERKEYTVSENDQEKINDIVPNSSIYENKINLQNNVEEINNACSNEQTSNSIKVFKRHIEMALVKVKPSVSESERQKYSKLYANFTNAKDGSFGNEPTGKRSTLA